MPKDEKTDRDAILGCLGGDTGEFRVLVDRYGGRVLGLCWRYVGRLQDAEDLTQKTFVDVYSNLHKFDTRRPFWPWVSRIAINNCKDYFKSAQRAEQLTLNEKGIPEGVYPEEREDAETAHLETERRAILERALFKLPVKYRSVLLLKDFQELPYKEIERLLELPVTTLKIRVIRARKKLHKAVRRVLREMKR